MKVLTLALGLLLGSWVAVSAQVLVEVTLEQNQFLPGEAVPATVRVTNRSGRTLQLGEDPDWLTFSVQASRSASVVSKYEEVPVVEPFTLATSQVASKKVDLAPYFNLTRPGEYRITATVRIKAWEATAASPPKNFDVIEGTKIWNQDFGVPSTDNAKPPEIRNYALLQANYLRSSLRLYFRLTEADGSKVVKVFPLGEVVSFGRPEAEVDRASRLHVLHQNGAHTSRYTVINPEGQIVLRQIFEYTQGSRPRLVSDKDGKFSVTGALRVLDKMDIPVPPEPKDDDDQK